jgi:DNA-binding MarR family transcriptional regulator
MRSVDDEPDADRPGEVRLGPLEHYIAFHLRLAQGASFRAFQRRSGMPGLRQGWFAVLMLIRENPGITPMALSRASGRDKSTMTPILRALEREGLVTREAVPGDRRSYALTLTAAGEARLAHLRERAAEHDARLDAIVGERKPELLTLLRRIVAELGEDG